MVEGTANDMYLQQAFVLLQIFIFQMEDRYSDLICKHVLTNIINVSQMFIKSLQHPTKPQGLVGQFPNIYKGNKEGYDYIDAFICRLKDNIGEPISTRYVREITGMIIRDDHDKNMFLPHQTSKHHYYAQWCFERGYIVTKKRLGTKSYTTLAEYKPRPFDAACLEGLTRLDCLIYTKFWRH